MQKYTIINPYYIKDDKGKKYDQEKTCKLLNHQNRIIEMKTELIKKLVQTNTILTQNMKKLQEKEHEQDTMVKEK